MYNDFIDCKNRIIRMIKFIRNEYELLDKNYSVQKIIKKSIPIKVSKNVDKKDKKQYEKIIHLTFYPILHKMSEMIDDNIIEWSEVSKQVELEDIKKDNEKIVELFYESCEKLYIYKKIRYNLFFDFLMQIYSFFEREMSKFIINSFNYKSDYISLFSSIRIIETNKKITINSDIKQNLNLYRNIMNVYKHGSGDSYEKIKSTNPDILNIIDYDNDMYFVLNLKKINIDQFINSIEKMLNELEPIM
jgi:hypothetical protein